MQYLMNKYKWRLFAFTAFISIAIPFAIVAYTLITTGAESVVFLDDYHPVFGILILLYYLLIIAIGTAWLVTQIIQIFRLKNETIKNELRHLQSQVNPHFFFNVLNNLYGLVARDTEKAQQLILKLSDMMRYSIYDGQKDLVTLAEEVNYLKSYIALHEMRYHKKSDIRMEMDIEDETLKIMPLMFIILVENAFKHGMERLRKDAFIHIKLYTTKNSLTFEVMNNYDPEATKEPRGVGLTNLSKRLSIMYPKKYKLHFAPVPKSPVPGTGSSGNDLIEKDSSEHPIYKASLTLDQL
jgi:two-component system sensor histidine kinase AlgZ